MNNELFNQKIKPTSDYNAKDIEVLEGLEPVRRRPGMYIGGSDESAMHHLIAEIFDNSMDEAVAGFASRIEVRLDKNNFLTIKDNGRGIPIDPHPKFKDKSALEVIMTTLHAGGKFSSDAYETSGGLHGVGISVVNALASIMTVEVARDKQLYRQEYSRGFAKSRLENIGSISNRRGTSISFVPDIEIFGEEAKFRPNKIYKLIRSKAYLFKGVEVRWSCDESLITDDTPISEIIHFPNGLKDFLSTEIGDKPQINKEFFAGNADIANGQGRIEWAISWGEDEVGLMQSFCNTIPTPLGGTHETGLRGAIAKGLRAFADMTGVKKSSQITPDDILGGAKIILSLFLKDPQFQGQTKDKLVSANANKLTENALRDPFDHWLSGDAENANLLLEHIIARVEDRLRKKSEKVNRKSTTQRLRLPGKLTDCSRSSSKGTEIFLVEGDSAGGSAKQARNRETQAILPLRGKILNVESATREKIHANSEIADMIQALGCGAGKNYVPADLRYEKIIIMTDADVDGAHIAALLMTFFYREMPNLVLDGNLYLACPPLFRITNKNRNYYASSDAEKDEIVASFKQGKIEIGRFKGLGEMTAPQLKETTMSPKSRVLLRVQVENADDANKRVGELMGKRPELRFAFIQEQTALHDNLIDDLDI